MIKNIKVCLALSASIVPGIVHAQVAGTANPANEQAAPNTTGGLEEIIVTAQRREENLQKVPLAIQVISPTVIASAGVYTTVDLQKVSPGLVIRNSMASFNPYLRGIGTAGANSEQPTALYIDGIYIAQPKEGVKDLADIENVAVLKGPQGTLFGRNATAGVIQITTRKPTQQFRGDLSASYDTYETFRGSAYVSGGLADNLAGSLSIGYQKSGQGYGRNLLLGTDNSKILGRFSARTKLVWESGGTSVQLMGDYFNNRDTFGGHYQSYRDAPQQIPFANPKRVYDTRAADPTFNRVRGGGAGLVVRQDLGFADLVSITSARRIRWTGQFDANGLPIRTITPIGIVHAHNETQELQLISDKNPDLVWATGAYYFRNYQKTDPYTRNFGAVFAPLPTSTVKSDTVAAEKTESLAPYAQATYAFLPDTRLTLGARYTWERRHYDATVLATTNAGTQTLSAPFSGQLTERQWTYRAALDHQVAQGILAYVSYNKGFKSGGFNLNTPTRNPATGRTKPYLGEKLDAFQGGLKTTLFDNRLRLNGEAFYYKYSNLQVAQFINSLQTITNAAKARLYGLDLDAEARIADGLTVTASLELLNAEFTSYPNAPCFTPNPAGGFRACPPQDLKGKDLPLAPKVNATITIDYKRPVSFGVLSANTSLTHTGRYFLEADNYMQQSSYDLLTATLGWSPESENFRISVWGRNLLNEEVIAQGYTAGLQAAVTYGGVEPRTFGVTVTAKLR